MRVKQTVTKGYVSIRFPLRVISEPNARGHWGKRHRRSSNQQQVVGYELAAVASSLRQLGLPLTIRLPLYATQKLDGDNLQAALKAVRDGVAKSIGIDDGDARVTWLYGFEPVTRGREVQIEIEKRG